MSMRDDTPGQPSAGVPGMAAANNAGAAAGSNFVMTDVDARSGAASPVSSVSGNMDRDTEEDRRRRVREYSRRARERRRNWREDMEARVECSERLAEALATIITTQVPNGAQIVENLRKVARNGGATSANAPLSSAASSSSSLSLSSSSRGDARSSSAAKNNSSTLPGPATSAAAAAAAAAAVAHPAADSSFSSSSSSSISSAMPAAHGTTGPFSTAPSAASQSTMSASASVVSSTDTGGSLSSPSWAAAGAAGDPRSGSLLGAGTRPEGEDARRALFPVAEALVAGRSAAQVAEVAREAGFDNAHYFESMARLVLPKSPVRIDALIEVVGVLRQNEADALSSMRHDLSSIAPPPTVTSLRGSLLWLKRVETLIEKNRVALLRMLDEQLQHCPFTSIARGDMPIQQAVLILPLILGGSSSSSGGEASRTGSARRSKR
jgi:hypothetical protein